jgi:hypothetical protein
MLQSSAKRESHFEFVGYTKGLRCPAVVTKVLVEVINGGCNVEATAYLQTVMDLFPCRFKFTQSTAF